MTQYVSFGAWLRSRRKVLDLTQNELAEQVGCAEETIRKLEAGGRRPSKEIAQRLADVLLAEAHERQAFILLARGRAPDAPPTSTLVPSCRSASHNLPTLLSSLIGRAHETAAIGQLLEQLGVRLLTLLGPPGVGKTRLSIQVAHELLEVFADGVWFVPLAPITDPALVGAAIAQTIGVVEHDAQPPRERLIDYLREKCMLLVLDNFEQVVDAALLVAELLLACPCLKVLITSRVPLRLSGEQVYPVSPLTLPDMAQRLSVEHVAESEAVRLFVARAQATQPSFALTPANAAVVAELCVRLDGLPLAIELAAARIKLFMPSALLQRLNQRFDLLVHGPRDLATRQQSIRNTLEWSYQLLASHEQRLFARLGVFVGGFTVEVAEAVCNADGDLPVEVLEGIAALLDQSLLRQDIGADGEPRLVMLETIREFALEQLRAQGEEPKLRDRHYVAYLEFVRTADSLGRGPEAALWLARLHPEQDNIRAALQWTLDQQRYADTAWLLVAVNWFWYLNGQWNETGQWIGQLLPHRSMLDIDLRLALMIMLYRVVHPYAALEQWNAEMMELLAACPNMHLHACAWHRIALTYYVTDYPRAVAGLEQAIACARAAGAAQEADKRLCLLADSSKALGGSLWAYGNDLVNKGEFARALPLLLESQDIFEQRGSRYEVCACLGTLGLLALLQGDLPRACAQLQEAVTITTEFNHQETLGFWQPVLGFVTLHTGDVAGARRILIDSLRRCTALKDPMLLARNMTFLAETALWEGQIDEAADWLAQSLAQEAEQGVIIIYEVVRLFVAAHLATAQERYERAATLFGLAEQANSVIHHAYAGPLRKRTDVALATVRAALDPAVFAEAWAAGQHLSLDEAFATILAPSAVQSNALERPSSS